jgi:hypothetical protein
MALPQAIGVMTNGSALRSCQARRSLFTTLRATLTTGSSTRFPERLALACS